jgi:hypothetical protein
MAQFRHLRTIWLIAAVAAGALVILLLVRSAPVAQARDMDCSDFNTQKQAQRWFRHHHPGRDPSHLDNDNDRIACESNPCPCSRKWHRQHGKVDAQRARRVVYAEFSSVRQHAPHHLVIGASQEIKRLHWHGWDSAHATSRGRFPFNDCKPFCADGHITDHSVSVRVSHVRKCHGVHFYLKLRYRFRNHVPDHARRTNRLRVHCSFLNSH